MLPIHDVLQTLKAALEVGNTAVLAAPPGAGKTTVVPLALYFKDGRAKVEIALATGKKHHDKRQALREKQDRREAEREMGVKRR